MNSGITPSPKASLPKLVLIEESKDVSVSPNTNMRKRKIEDSSEELKKERKGKRIKDSNSGRNIAKRKIVSKKAPSEMIEDNKKDEVSNEQTFNSGGIKLELSVDQNPIKKRISKSKNSDQISQLESGHILKPIIHVKPKGILKLGALVISHYLNRQIKEGVLLSSNFPNLGGLF